MKQTDVTVTFYLKKSEMNDEGHCPVMAKLVVGKFSEAAFSAKMSVPAALWASGRATGKSNARGKSTGNWTICELQPFPFMTNCQPPVRM